MCLCGSDNDSTSETSLETESDPWEYLGGASSRARAKESEQSAFTKYMKDCDDPNAVNLYSPHFPSHNSRSAVHVNFTRVGTEEVVMNEHIYETSVYNKELQQQNSDFNNVQRLQRMDKERYVGNYNEEEKEEDEYQKNNKHGGGSGNLGGRSRGDFDPVAIEKHVYSLLKKGRYTVDRCRFNTENHVSISGKLVVCVYPIYLLFLFVYYYACSGCYGLCLQHLPCPVSLLY